MTSCETIPRPAFDLLCSDVRGHEVFPSLTDVNGDINQATERKVKKQKKTKAPSEEQHQAELEVPQGDLSPVKEKKEKKKKVKSKKENESKPASDVGQDDEKAEKKPSEIQEKKKAKKAKKQDSAKSTEEIGQTDNGKNLKPDAQENTQIAEEKATKKKKKKRSKKTTENAQAEQPNLPPTDKVQFMASHCTSSDFFVEYWQLYKGLTSNKSKIAIAILEVNIGLNIRPKKSP